MTRLTLVQAFLRYFRPQDGPFVENVFRTLANIPLDKVLTGADVVDYITTPDLQNLSPLLSQVFVRLEDDPEHFCSSNPRVNAYMGYDNPGQAANIYLCDLAYSWPSIEEIASPPQTPWARDPVGRPLPGYSCANLGDHDSDWMKTPGSIILHELLHWGFFFASVPSWKSTIVYKNSEWKILDYKGQAGPPSNGYGPYNAKMLKDEFSTTDQVWPETLNNVENYVWFAVSKYWSWRCGAVFGPAQSDDDAHRREDSGYRPKWP